RRRDPYRRPLAPRDDHREGRSARRLYLRGLALAVVHGSLRQLRGSPGRRPQQGPGGEPARGAQGGHGEEAALAEEGSRMAARCRHHAAHGRLVPRHRGRNGARRRRGRPGRGLGGRIGHHRRIRARDPRIGRRLLFRDGRHARAVRLARRAGPGESFLDRMISMVESARRQRTPNEIALTVLLVVMTLVFLLACATLLPYALYSVELAKKGEPVSITTLTALLVCLIPTTIGGLLSAIGIAGMGRMIAKNVVAMSGRAVEAAGDVDVLLLDKTGTITLGNREATQFIPATGVNERELAKQKYGLRERDLAALKGTFIPFSAHTRMSGVDVEGKHFRKGAADAIRTH